MDLEHPTKNFGDMPKDGGVPGRRKSAGTEMVRAAEHIYAQIA